MKQTHANSAVDKKERRALLAKRKEACPRCPPHDGENRGRRQRPDRHKNVRADRA